MRDLVIVSRTVSADGVTIVESASAPLPDDLVIGIVSEAILRGQVATALFASLPSVQSKSPPCPSKPLNSNN